MKYDDITINSILQDLYNIYNINNKGLNSEAMTSECVQWNCSKSMSVKGIKLIWYTVMQDAIETNYE